MTKVLRVGIIRGDNAAEEHVFGNTSVTMGDLDFPLLPTQKGFKLFELIEGKYVLNFNDRMRGRIGEHKLDSFYVLGLCTKKEGVFTFPLNDHSRGRVSLNDHAVLFQFVEEAPSEEAPKERLEPDWKWIRAAKASIEETQATSELARLRAHLESLCHHAEARLRIKQRADSLKDGSTEDTQHDSRPDVSRAIFELGLLGLSTQLHNSACAFVRLLASRSPSPIVINVGQEFGSVVFNTPALKFKRWIVGNSRLPWPSIPITMFRTLEDGRVETMQYYSAIDAVAFL